MFSTGFATIFSLILPSISIEGSRAGANTKPVSQSVWIFKYPYADGAACECQESQIGSYKNFTSENGCIAAFRDELYETCSVDEGGVTEESCGNVVSTTTVKTNTECSSDCTKVIADTTKPPQQFFDSCKIEAPVEFGDSCALPISSCFNNYVYGWGDFDPHNLVQAAPLQIFHNVPTAAKCQGLCQQTTSCVSFTWRAHDDVMPRRAYGHSLYDFQNPANTCLLFDKSYMDGVLNTSIDSSAILSGPSKYCNVVKVRECLMDVGDFSTFNPLLERPCLICGCEPICVWQSSKHVSGPVSCSKTHANLCKFDVKPPVTPTRPPRPVCPESCVDNCDDYIDDCFPDC